MMSNEIPKGEFGLDLKLDKYTGTPKLAGEDMGDIPFEGDEDPVTKFARETFGEKTATSKNSR